MDHNIRLNTPAPLRRTREADGQVTDTPHLPLRARTHLLPTLFDRLCDEAPSRQFDPPQGAAVSASRLRGILQRDLAFLLNTVGLSRTVDLSAYPEVAASTLNYGLPPLAGTYASEHSWAEIEQVVRKAIVNFEPRLAPDSLVVTPLQTTADGGNHNVLEFEIRGQIRMDPYPVEFLVQTSVDLETRHFTLKSTS